MRIVTIFMVLLLSMLSAVTVVSTGLADETPIVSKGMTLRLREACRKSDIRAEVLGSAELIMLLHASDPRARLNAAYALGETRSANAVEALIYLLKDPLPQMRRISARALGKIGDSRAVMPLIEVLCRENEPKPVRAAAATSLGRLGDSRARRILAQVALTEKGRLAERAAWALYRLASSPLKMASLNRQKPSGERRLERATK